MRAFASALALAFAMASTGKAQDQSERKFVVVEFLKIAAGKGAEYRDLERKWKEVHQDRVNKKQVESWSLYSVRLPGASASRKYDTITMHVFSSFQKLERMYDEEQQAKIRTLPPAGPLRTMVDSQIWSVFRTAGPDLLSSKYAEVLFHKAKPGHLGDYLRAQSEHYAPINEELVKSGVRNAWHSFGLMFPGGTEREYDWVTFDCFEKFDAVAGDTTAGIDRQRVAAAAKAVSQHRDTVRAEYWQLLDRTATSR